MPKSVRHCPCLFNNCFLVGLLAGKVYKESIIRDNVAQEFPWKTRAKALRVVPKVAQVAGSWQKRTVVHHFPFCLRDNPPTGQPFQPSPVDAARAVYEPNTHHLVEAPYSHNFLRVDGGEITFTQLYSRKPLRCMETCGDGEIIKLIESKVMILSYLTLLNLFPDLETGGPITNLWYND